MNGIDGRTLAIIQGALEMFNDIHERQPLCLMGQTRVNYCTHEECITITCACGEVEIFDVEHVPEPVGALMN